MSAREIKVRRKDWFRQSIDDTAREYELDQAVKKATDRKWARVHTNGRMAVMMDVLKIVEGDGTAKEKLEAVRDYLEPHVELEPPPGPDI